MRNIRAADVDIKRMFVREAATKLLLSGTAKAVYSHLAVNPSRGKSVLHTDALFGQKECSISVKIVLATHHTLFLESQPPFPSSTPFFFGKKWC